MIFHCDNQTSKVESYRSVDGYFGDKAQVYLCDSDEFFSNVNITDIVVGFIDGDHLYEQVRKDFNNIFAKLVPNGYIFMHDTYPGYDDDIDENRCGTVYKLRQELEDRKDLECFTFPYSAWETGLTMVRKLPEDLPYYRR